MPRTPQQQGQCAILHQVLADLRADESSRRISTPASRLCRLSITCSLNFAPARFCLSGTHIVAGAEILHQRIVQAGCGKLLAHLMKVGRLRNAPRSPCRGEIHAEVQPLVARKNTATGTSPAKYRV